MFILELSNGCPCLSLLACPPALNKAAKMFPDAISGFSAILWDISKWHLGFLDTDKVFPSIDRIFPHTDKMFPYSDKIFPYINKVFPGIKRTIPDIKKAFPISDGIFPNIEKIFPRAAEGFSLL
jgi:hypothetical protein